MYYGLVCKQAIGLLMGKRWERDGLHSFHLRFFVTRGGDCEVRRRKEAKTFAEFFITRTNSYYIAVLLIPNIFIHHRALECRHRVLEHHYLYSNIAKIVFGAQKCADRGTAHRAGYKCN